MSDRQRPANRRQCWRLKFVWHSSSGATFKYFGTISYGGTWDKPDLSRPLELFINSSKVTSDASYAASEAAIFASLALQSGWTVKELLEKTVKRPNGLGEDIPATAVGQLLALIDAGLLIPEELRDGGELRSGFTLYRLEEAH